MLTNTFLHLKGVGRQTEQNYWRKGVSNWDQYAKMISYQYSLLDTQPTPPILRESIEALEAKNMDFFAETLPSSDYYRVALTFPKDVLFLDIETTGLSSYYDIITIVGWSIGRHYGVYINGQDDSLFREALAEAKAIVTFNGIMFDLKFIEKHFSDIDIPKVHIDLRFLAKRVGLTGGQKAIEKELGFVREKEIEDMLGEAAPILWHKYRRGENDALKRLIEYNYADVEGMKTILDVCIERLYIQNKIPSKIRRKTKFSKIQSKIDWAKRKPSKTSYKVYVPSFEGSTAPLITYSQLNELHSLDTFTVAGIDLVSSEERETGFCILKGSEASTCRVKTDDEMIQMALDANVDLVSIDSPLSIPKGRTTFWDDDTTRNEFGIMRECERILHRRGIKSYPCLIQSMQKLTQRGMLLANKFRKLGIPVIESYPGAAQDIMSIPRKQAGLEYLVEGLKEFGITGAFTHTPVSHDELDAITSAVVGHFFWVGKFEALGNPEEEYLFIPDLHADHKSWQNRKIFGISGHIGAGKTAVATILKDRGFKYTRYSLVLQGLLEKDGVPITRSELQKIGVEIYQTKGQRWLGNQVLELVQEEKNVVIDGLRHPEDHALLFETYGPAYKHVFVSSPLDIREQRVVQSEREDVAPKESFKHASEHDVELIKSLADISVVNDSSPDDLFKKVLELI